MIPVSSSFLKSSQVSGTAGLVVVGFAVVVVVIAVVVNAVGVLVPVLVPAEIQKDV